MTRGKKLVLGLLTASSVTACAAPGQHAGSAGGQCSTAGYETSTSGSIGAGYNTERGQISTFGIGIHLRPRRSTAGDCVVANNSTPRVGVSLDGRSENASDSTGGLISQVGVTLSG